MNALGEELYAIINQVYPELAGKLTGMIMSEGEEECRACLASQERLAEKLDLAFDILDKNGQCTVPRAKAAAAGAGSQEKRIDPEDGQARTLAELRTLCAGRYSDEEIDAYWGTCAPVAAAPPKAKAAAKSAVVSVGTAAPSKKAPAPSPAKAPPPAATSPAGATGAPAGAVGDDGDVRGLGSWLRELKLSGYIEKASAWVEEQGASHLDEIVENLDEFIEAMGFKPLESKRLQQNAAAAAKATLEQLESRPAPPQEAPSTQTARKPPAQSKAAAPTTEEDEEAKMLEQMKRELQELEEMKAEMLAREEEVEGGASRSGGAPKAKPAAQGPAVRVQRKAAAPAPAPRSEQEVRRERELQRQAEAEEAARAAAEKQEAKARQAEERRQRAEEKLAAQVAGTSPGGEGEEFPALGAGGGWQAAGAGKKGKKR